eukprot:Blabericola_migrator_1__13351@NODE_943_length_5948_cov_104_280565_g654_i0_p2_GENE_NODE_943_length_5948_cov_104_280565_g654_i0NODE_943_length_5948_cov_104_280565_g654_i0_p2_ORF_typecomplete_len685_score70_62Glycos_transf_2/PF00535_26/4_1e20Glyco_tranf_2_3/PF13641_6/4_5e18Glyco_transf_7C/PF02709_14/9_7e16Glyco_tranf_2_2/PF10111_9/4_5e13Ricin_B_lectin/PF00652_22/8e13RicinB_lectin_2/PF14200_6/0_0046RicinB_lectin_2/PF14200_6/5_1CDtoxinA/PF03498_14/8_4e03CDtoxinA/PF03498_14/1_6e02CDtoxinA/PF03498_14/0
MNRKPVDPIQFGQSTHSVANDKKYWPSVRWRSWKKLCRRHKWSPAIYLASLVFLVLLLLVFGTQLYSVRNTEVLIHDFSQPTLVPSPDLPSNSYWKGGPISAYARSELIWNYSAREKKVPFVGHEEWLEASPKDSRHYINSLVVVPGYDEHHAHGQLGVYPNGSQAWLPAPKPPPLDKYPGGKEVALQQGGFYLAMSDALPLSRTLPDLRAPVCHSVNYNYTAMGDASIVITFYNEPLSTLLRTVHSVLNHSPAPLIREIILVDDHSDAAENMPGGPLYEHISLLPKVKLMRLPERKGIVQARIAGAKVAQGSVLLILDSHIEVNVGWLEPQLARIAEIPEAIVFPQIFSLTHDTFEPKTNAGIGCWLTFRWVAVEQAALTGKPTSVEPVASPSMAGGLFAVDREWFWELGGYDEGFVAWGAENVEMAFRAWMCGGRVECTPCSHTYHIYRKGGTGYANPAGALWRNRKRTARIWMDEHYQLASPMIDLSALKGAFDIGNFDKMLELKKRLNCKSFKWYLENVDPTHDVRDLDDVIGLGRIKHESDGLCLDLGGSRTVGHRVILYPCHPEGNYTANQGFLISAGDNRIRAMANDKRCVGVANGVFQIEQCNDKTKSPHWQPEPVDDDASYYLRWTKEGKEQCLAVGAREGEVVSGPLNRKRLFFSLAPHIGSMRCPCSVALGSF